MNPAVDVILTMLVMVQVRLIAVFLYGLIVERKSSEGWLLQSPGPSSTR